MSIILVGVNHKTAPVEVRERLAFDDAACAAGLRSLVDGDVVRCLPREVVREPGPIVQHLVLVGARADHKPLGIGFLSGERTRRGNKCSCGGTGGEKSTA